MQLLEKYLYIWKYNIQDIDVKALQHCTQYLTPEEYQRAHRFVHKEDTYRQTIAYAGLRLILAQVLSLPPMEITFQTTAHGKPYLPKSSISFNISHANDWVVWGMATNNEIGLDVEYERADIELLALAKRFFASEEYDALKATNLENRLSAFYRCWTRKEAFIKAIGQGLSHPLNTFVVPFQEQVFEYLLSQATQNTPWYLYSFQMPCSYQGAVVVKNKVQNIRIKNLKQQDILHYRHF